MIDFKRVLQDKKLRATPIRLKLLEALQKASRNPMSAEELHEKLLKGLKRGCDLASVYRNLEVLTRRELVLKRDFLSQASRFELLCSEKVVEHRHFFRCESCDTRVPIEDCSVGRIEKKLRNLGYRNLTHHLELKGLCPSCAI